MHRIYLALLFLLTLSAEASVKVCKGIFFTAESISFSTVEKSLMCDDAGGDEWKSVTSAQKELFLTRFLRQRGYYYPKFTHSKGETTVETGGISYLHIVNIENDILNLDPERLWKIYNKAMTSDILDTLEGWVKKEYSLAGYPCIEISTLAYPKKNSITINIRNADLKSFGKISSENIPNVNYGTEKRYQAFTTGEIYNEMAVQLTARRLENDEFVVKTNFAPQCIKHSKIVDVNQTIMPGKAKLISVGVGFDSDELFILEAAWKNSRLFSHASFLQARLYASWEKQKIGFDQNWYYSPVITRHHLKSSFNIEHEDSFSFETRSLKISSGPAIDYDLNQKRISLWLAPVYTLTNKSRGHGPEISNNITIKTAFILESHEFEFYKSNPQDGFKLLFEAGQAEKGFASNYTATSYNISGKYLHNLLKLEPPIWVLGLRGRFTALDYPKEFLDEIPPNLFLSLGGSDSIRGFAKDRIPKEKATMTAYLGAELRLCNLMPWNLHPFVFFDIAKAKTDYINFSNRTFLSPGAGTQWASPIGLLRFTVAYSLRSGNAFENENERNSGAHFHLSLGEQF